MSSGSIKVTNILVVKNQLVILGIVQSGILKPGQTIEVPSGKKGKVLRIELHGKELLEANIDQHVGFSVSDLEKDQVNSGDILTIV